MADSTSRRTRRITAVGGLPPSPSLPHDLAEHARAEQVLRMQYAVSSVLVAAATLEEAAPRILQAIGHGLDWHFGALWCVDQPGSVLHCHTIWPMGAVAAAEFEAISRQIQFPPGIGLPGRVWASGEPAWVADILTDRNFPRRPWAATAGLHGAVAFPVRSGSGILGVIEFFSHTIRPLDEDLLRTVALLGNEIGQFIERTRAEAALHRAKDDLEARVAERTAALRQVNERLQRELTERTRAEEALRASEARYRAVVDTAYDAIIMATAEGRIQSFNHGAERIFGYTAAEVIGQPLTLLMPDRFRAAHTAGMQRYLSTGEAHVLDRTLELTGQRQDGREFPPGTDDYQDRAPDRDPLHRHHA